MLYFHNHSRILQTNPLKFSFPLVRLGITVKYTDKWMNTTWLRVILLLQLEVILMAGLYLCVESMQSPHRCEHL